MSELENIPSHLKDDLLLFVIYIVHKKGGLTKQNITFIFESESVLKTKKLDLA